MSFTQPVCDLCWNKENPDRVPVKMKEDVRDLETCCKCGSKTRSGIYIRIDPKTVAFPQ